MCWIISRGRNTLIWGKKNKILYCPFKKSSEGVEIQDSIRYSVQID